MVDLTRGELEECGLTKYFFDSHTFLILDLDVPWIFYTSSTVSVNPPRPFLYRNYNPCPARPSRYNGGFFSSI